MSKILNDYEAKFERPAPTPEQIEESVVVEVAAEHLAKGKPIPDNFDWWAALPRQAYA